MPHTIAQFGFTTVALAVAMVVTFLAVRRWGDEETDLLVVAWRRWAALGRIDTAKPAAKAKPKPKPKSKPTRASRTRKTSPGKQKPPPSKPKPQPRKAPTRPKPKATPAPEAAPEATTEMPVVEPAAEEAEPAQQTDEPVVVQRDEPLESPPEPEPVAQEAPASIEPAVHATETTELQPVGDDEMNTDRDHVPLSDEAEKTDDLSTAAEPKLAFRHRFRRGLRKTREFLNQDVRDVFTREPGPEDFDRLEEALVAADVGVATASAITDDLRKRDDLRANVLTDVLKDSMLVQLGTADRRLRLQKNKLSVWIVAGVNGTGKTTTIAKLAARAKALGLKVTLAAADTYRAAAIEQLAEWSNRIGVDIVRQAQGADPGAVAFDAVAHAKAEDHDLVIIDTAGRLHTRKPLMDELEKIVRIVGRAEDAVLAECLLVIDATTGQNGIAQARAFREAVGVTGLVLAKLDGSAKGGIVFAVERELDVPVKAVGVGEHQNDLVPFDPKTFVDALFGEDDGED